MTISTGRYALISAMVTIGLLAGPIASGPAEAATRGAAVTFGTGSSAAGAGQAQPCATGAATCAGSDPHVNLTWTGATDTTGCRFSVILDWNDGRPAQTARFRGAGAGHVWRIGHTYPGGTSARHAYRIRATAAVIADRQARGCSIRSAAVTFTLLCTADQLSGPAWNSRWPGGNRDLSALDPGFRRQVEPFVAAMTRAGITVQPQSTLRSPQRSYLMHFSYLVSKGLLAPQNVPAYVPLAGEKGPQVCWSHRTASGGTDRTASVAAARTLLGAMGVDPSLRTAPALHSRHNTGDAIDMSIRWSAATVKIQTADGRTVKITSKPHDGTNPDLIEVGAGYGVRHFYLVHADRNHWSNDGH